MLPLIKHGFEWKPHFIEAYELREAAGIFVGQAGYHGAANVHDNNERSLAESLAQIQLANNVAMQSYQSNIPAVSEETRELCAALVATQQQLANLMRGPGPAGMLGGNLARAWWPAMQPMSPVIILNNNRYIGRRFSMFNNPGTSCMIQCWAYTRGTRQ